MSVRVKLCPECGSTLPWLVKEPTVVRCVRCGELVVVFSGHAVLAEVALKKLEELELSRDRIKKQLQSIYDNPQSNEFERGNVVALRHVLAEMPDPLKGVKV